MEHLKEEEDPQLREALNAYIESNKIRNDEKEKRSVENKTEEDYLKNFLVERSENIDNVDTYELCGEK